jgi:hypothetical protein
MARSYYGGSGMYGAIERAAQQNYGAEFSGGSDYASQLLGAIAKIQQTKQENELANRLMNVQNAPRAALVAPGVSPTTGQANVIPTGVSTAGTAPATGGTQELQLRNALSQQDLSDQLKRAQIENYLAMARGTGRYAPKPTPTGLTPAQLLAEWHRQQQAEEKANAGRLKNIQSWQKANTYDVPRLVKEFDTVHEKGSAEKFYNAYTNVTGSYGRNVDGKFVVDPGGDLYSLDDSGSQTVPVAELQAYLSKLKEITAAGGKLVPAPQALPVTAGTGASVSPTTATNQSNLPAPSTDDEYKALPSGAAFIDGDGQVKTKP